MIKTAFAAAAAAVAFAAPGAALAGPYVNVETNAGWTGTDYTGATTDFHVGYEGALGESAAWYVQGGASYVSPDGAADDTVPLVRQASPLLLPRHWVSMVKSPSKVLATATSTVDTVVNWV